MKKQIIGSMVGVALLGVGVTVYAQVAPVQTAAPMSMEAPMATTTIVPAPISATATAPISAKEAKKIRLQETVSRMENSMQVRIANLDDLAMRIQVRIGKVQQEGKDMTAATAKLAEAQKAIASAKLELEKLKKADSAMIVSAKPLVGFGTIKTKLIKNVTVKIKAAHKALVEVVVIIKGQGVPPTTSPMATTSTSTIQ